ncbi:Cqd1p NDAI_0E02550 [Naumovozyma dairenensis CBS 421]|uniref:Protein kinase domain-containing protein n=1 Tax=Naumovozyma dairenensis (strain ATCC 10597 / BCRC 20456 / CBS 421 / NBRC 0211 / NRRL Y-12639) TaxID=1071378 RepID=G0WBF2_NAUDC|nr:hypothetical protein NDAI_0E02550 [Naumovozyma dairenensis CBS 421]CCD25072.1 hypothetical protein NDAI_0E02550 [Naumovozyma dairenensis CBS 421]
MSQLRIHLNQSWRYFNRSSFKLKYPSPRHTLLPTACILYYNREKILQRSNRSLLLNDTLKSDPNGDTFEMGLYLSSQREIRDKLENDRQSKLEGSRNLLIRLSRVFIYQIKDSLIEPIFTLLRFLELSTIFLPVLLIYPITYLGRPIQLPDGEVDTRGSLLWCKLVKIALEYAGPSFIKLGQWAGSRNDIFSKTLCDALSQLHSNVSPHPFKYTKKVLCEMLNVGELGEAFDEINEKPLGVGAIAQVYVAKLSELFVKKHNVITNNGNGNGNDANNRWCAIKIIHPNVRKQISRDLKIMDFFARCINSLPNMEWLSLPDEVEQFSILMNLQLDLRIEALNLKRFNENFKNDLQIKFANVFLNLCNKDVLFEEYIYGFPMGDFLKIKTKINDDNLCRRVSDPFVDAFLKMLILDDFIHADLHPGNVLIRFVKTNKYGTSILSSEVDDFKVTHSLRKKFEKQDPEFILELKHVLENYTPQVCFIDTGLVTELNDKNRVNFIDLFNALARFNGYRAGELMIERSRTPETAIDKELFALKVKKLTDKVKQRTFTLGTVSIGDLLEQMLTMVRSHHVRMEGDFVSVVVAILLLEGIGRQLDPDLDLFERFVFFALIKGLKNKTNKKHLLTKSCCVFILLVYTYSSLPILREYGFSGGDKTSLLKDTNTFTMLKIWLGLEIRKLMTLSIKELYNLVKWDELCPNY